MDKPDELTPAPKPATHPTKQRMVKFAGLFPDVSIKLPASLALQGPKLRIVEDISTRLGSIVSAPGYEAVRQLSESIQKVTGGFSEAFKRQTALLARITLTNQEIQRIEAAGWLPHYTTPYDAVADFDDDAEALSAHLEAYYRTEWPSVRETFLEKQKGYAISAEAKETFRQALDAHGHGLYRLTARALFPELERVAREELYAGTLKPITSQKELQELAGKLSLHDTEPGGLHGWALFTKFFDHLYENTTTPETLAVATADSVPNRHAALHGLLSYETPRHSMNALIMADFILQVICAVKRYQAEEASTRPI